MTTSDTVLLTRGVLILYAAAQLTFEWWYFRAWYWLPKTSPKRLFGWPVLLASVLAIPLAVYPNVSGVHRDNLSLAILFGQMVAVIATLVLNLKRGAPSS